jgi:hypothetical protein
MTATNRPRVASERAKSGKPAPHSGPSLAACDTPIGPTPRAAGYRVGIRIVGTDPDVHLYTSVSDSDG